MKKLLLGLTISLLSSGVLANEAPESVTATYHGSSCSSVKKAAKNGAINECQEQGFVSCEFKGLTLLEKRTSWTSEYCEYKGTALGYKETFIRFSQWKKQDRGISFGGITLGANDVTERVAARNRALSDCRAIHGDCKLVGLPTKQKSGSQSRFRAVAVPN